MGTVIPDETGVGIFEVNGIAGIVTDDFQDGVQANVRYALEKLGSNFFLAINEAPYHSLFLNRLLITSK